MPLAILGRTNTKEMPEKCGKKSQNNAQIEIDSQNNATFVKENALFNFISSKNRTNSCNMSAYHQLNKTKTA